MHGYTPDGSTGYDIPGRSVSMSISEGNTNASGEHLMPHSQGSGTSASCEMFGKDALFSSKEDLKHKVSVFALKNNFEFRVKKSDKGRYLVACVDQQCTWKLHSMRITSTDTWSITTYVPEHTCNLSMLNREHRQASSSVIGRLFKSKFTTIGRNFKPKDLIADVRTEFGANISYERAWRARECARAFVHGTPEESYSQLPIWSAMLESRNPGTVTHIKTDDDGRFQCYFMALGQSIRGFRHMRPVVVVDGTFLKNRYSGVLYVAATKDANEQIYPLAFGAGETESYETYAWFFSRFKEAFGDRPDLVFITDRHASFSPAIHSVFPDANHVHCHYHLRCNMKSKCTGISKYRWGKVCQYYEGAAKAYLVEDFCKYMAQIKALQPECFEYLMQADPSKWSRSHFPGNRYSAMTTNACESINAALKDAREYPLIPLLESIRSMMQRWFYERRNEADASRSCPVSKHVDNILRLRNVECGAYNVIACNMYEFEVHGADYIGHVNMRSKECSCREFTMDGYPCVHAMAVCKYRSINPYTLCDSFYTTDVLYAGYEETIYPLGDPKHWNASDDIMGMVVLPPSKSRDAGRPRVTRILSQGEE